MARLEQRISRLEGARNVSPSVGPPILIVARLGESEDAAILRVCGPNGLPPRPPEAGPHLIVIPIRSRNSGQGEI
jgi:hypothetical protein